jgi:hypothetical protein
MKFKVPTLDNLKNEGINTAGLFVGVIGGYAMQQFLMKERTAKDGTVKKAIIADNIVFNAVGLVAGLGFAAATSTPFAKFVGLGVAVIFGIRMVNRATDKLSGLGNLNGGLKTFLENYVPTLKGIDGPHAWDMPLRGQDYINEPMMLPMGGFEGNTQMIHNAAVDFPMTTAPVYGGRAGRHA